MIKVLELFAGIGACSKALENLGIEHEIVDAVEIDKYAIRSFNAIHGTNFEPQDITEWNKDIECDLIMHGSPCFPAGTPIITNNGYKNIEDIKVGDIVLSHDGKYHNIEKIGGKKNVDTITIKATGMLPICCTKNHPFYTIRRTTHKKHYGVEYEYSDPIWTESSELTKEDYISINIPQKEINPLALTEEDCWLFGRYVADGHLRYAKRRGRLSSYQHGVIYSVGNNKIEEFKKHLVSHHASIYPHSNSVYRVVISSMEMVKLIKKLKFGEGALNKCVPQYILDLPKELAKAFLEGYLSGDGCYYKHNNMWSATTISRELALGLQQLVAKVYGVLAKISYTKMSPKSVIEGRVVNQHSQYSVHFYTEKKAKNSWFIAENKIWAKVRNIHESRAQDVFNLQVGKANSYTAYNVIVHNCQDFSIAGLQAGGDAGAGTRSSLMYESLRIIEKLKPKYVIWENVKNLLSKNHRHNFDAYQEAMEKLGYKNYYQVLNAKNYGVPQNRERVFTVSILGGGDFTFPEPIPLEKKLKDVLEPVVDEKYYLSDKAIASYTKHLERHKERGNGFKFEPTTGNNVAHCISTKSGSRQTDNYIKVAGTLKRAEPFIVASRGRGENNEQHLEARHDGTSNTITSVQKDNYVAIKTANSKGYDLATDGDGIDLAYPDSKTRRGRVGHGVAKTLPTSDSQGVMDGVRIRKLTPTECWKLMGFTKEDCEKASNAGISNSQLFKQAGNSIVVDVLMAILKELLDGTQH